MKKILIVDDAQNIRITLKRCLESPENQIDIAMNGEEALKKIRENDYDLVFLDLMIPSLSGMELLRKIRLEGNKVNIVIITAYGTVENAVESMKLGVIDFVQKPFSPGEIRRIVSAVWVRNIIDEKELKNFDDYLEFAKQRIQNGDYLKAEHAIKKALEINSEDAEAHYYFGILSENSGNLENAIENYRAALKISPFLKQAEENLNRLLNSKMSKNNEA